MARPQAELMAVEAELLRALTREQLAQITELTRRLALVEAQRDESADLHLLRAGMDALEHRLQDIRAISLGREATLAAQILADGAALQNLLAERDSGTLALDHKRQTAEHDRNE